MQGLPTKFLKRIVGWNCSSIRRANLLGLANAGRVMPLIEAVSESLFLARG